MTTADAVAGGAGTADGDAAVLARLRTAPFEVVGRFTDASNATLLVRLTDRADEDDARATAAPGDAEADAGAPDLSTIDPGDLAVHKPARGERPLWDFPVGTLHRREVAAYELSRAGGFDLVPPTVLREDGPFGPGSLQRYVDHDPELHYFRLLELADEAVLARLADLALLDLVLDNADRKAGHVLVATGEGPLAARIAAVDHGVCLNVEPKLRTVVWHLAGCPVPAATRTRLAVLGEALGGGALVERLAALVSPAELAALMARLETLLGMTELPGPTGPHDLPWPLV